MKDIHIIRNARAGDRPVTTERLNNDDSDHRPDLCPRSSWLARAESWMDARGKGAWIAAMVLGFIFFWPLGLALLAYMTWSKRMFSSKSCSRNPAAR